MNIEEILKKSNLPIEDKEIKFNEPMNKHSTFKIGGPAECFIKINKEEQLKEILKIAKQNKIPLTIIGSDFTVGYSEAKNSTLLNLIESYSTYDHCDAVDTIKNNGNLEKCIKSNKK